MLEIRRSRHLPRLSIQACSQSPLAVALPAGPVSTNVTQPTRWWVTAPPTESKRGFDEAAVENAVPEPEMFTAITGGRSAGHWRAVVLFITGCVAVLVAWLINGIGGFSIGAVGVCALS